MENWNQSGEHLMLKAAFTPLVLSSMSNVNELGVSMCSLPPLPTADTLHCVLQYIPKPFFVFSKSSHNMVHHN